ncbi:hypothetical protein ACV1CV_02750 [Aeromonas veronii]
MSRESGAGPERNGNGGGMSGNTGRGGGGSSSSGKGGGRNDSGGSSRGSSKNDKMGGKQSNSQSTGFSSMGGASSYGMDKGSFANSIGANNEGKQAGKGGGKNDNNSVASRISSVSKTLDNFKATSTPPNHNISSIGGPSMYGMHDGSLGGKVKGALGMGPSTNFNETIKTDNVNGVIGNLQRKAQNGTLTARDKANIADASGAFNKQAGANIFGGALLGGAGKAVAGLVGDVGNTDSYFSGIGRDAARGDFDSERLTGQRGQSIGSEGGLDSTLKAAMGFLSGVVPGASQLVSGVASGLTQPASGFGAALNDLNVQAGNAVSQAGASHSNGNGGSKGDTASAPPRYSLPSNSDLDKSMAGDFNFSPSRFDVTPGIRAQYAWDGE